MSEIENEWLKNQPKKQLIIFLSPIKIGILKFNGTYSEHLHQTDSRENVNKRME